MPLAKMLYTMRPNIWQAAMGTNSDQAQELVRSRSRPTLVIPRMPGKAPAVLVSPRSAAAYLGDKSCTDGSACKL